MKTFVCIPTGQRADRAAKTVRLWRQHGFDVACYAWDEETARAVEHACTMLARGPRRSFAVLQNQLAREVNRAFKDDWDAVVCGADDLWPCDTYAQLLRKFIDGSQGEVLWVYDGLNKDLATHPVVTREWYRKYGMVFDEDFLHNCCDVDLMLRCDAKNELTRVIGMQFDHRHPIDVPLDKRDVVYQLGYASLQQDRRTLLRKHPNFDLRGLRPSVVGGEA